MPPTLPPNQSNRSTRTDLAPTFDPAEDCRKQGGIWTGQRCILPGTQEFENARARESIERETGQPFVLAPGQVPQNEPKQPTTPGVDRSFKFNPDGSVDITGADGETRTLTKEEYEIYKDFRREGRGPSGVTPGLSAVSEALNLPDRQQLQVQQQQLEAQRLAGTLGQFQEAPISPTGLDVGEAVTTGLIGSIPRALGLAVTGAGAGLVGGGAIGSVIPGAGTAAGAGAGAIIGGVGGFISGISGAMLSNFRSQRVDTVNAQKRVLDEGKQNLNDWATLAASDPANRALYVANFNQQLALIDQAYRQMKLDTTRDVAKFETALPDLAEFEAFYASQGERDFLTTRMLNALQVPQDPQYIYQMQELSQRRLGQNLNTRVTN